jgi:PAS domain S-box-containing protein
MTITRERDLAIAEAHLLRAVVDTAVDGVILIDADGRVQMFNPACEKLFGYAAAEVIGQNVKVLMPPRYSDEHDRYLASYQRTGVKKIIGIGREVTGQRKDGTRFPMDLSVGEAKEDGKSIFVGIIHDLTERERASREIRETAARMRALVETAVDGVILIDADGRVQMFNPACEKLFGYVAAEVIGQNVKMLMPSPYRDEHDRYLNSYARTAVKKIIGIGREVTGQRKDGSTFPMDLSVGETMEDGKPIFVGIIHDLTERERAGREIRETAARMRALVETAVDGVIMIDAKGRVQTFNPACEKLFGYAAGEVIGKNVKMLMPAPYRDEHDRYLDNFHRTGERKIIGIGREVTGQRRDGTTFPMGLSVGEARQDGESIFVGIIHDLTGRKHTEEQLIQAQKMEAVGQLSGGIAHDFNNLLTVIVGNAEFLGEELRARHDLQRLAFTIVQAGERGAELTQRLLAYGRRQTLNPVEIDCNQLVTGMRKLMQRTLSEEIDIKVALDTELASAFADAGQLENAILNLAINAKDAMPSGGTITITTANMHLDERYSEQHPEVHPGHYVMIAITDDGHGMPKHVLEHVFEPFFTTKDVGKGSGLGLSMVYGFVKQSNGHVAIYSEPDLGTTVRIYLPATTMSAERKLRLAPELEPAYAGQETILIAEDDPFVRAYAVTCLESLGYRVVEAVDGRDALNKMARGAAADLLFTDVVMPGGINGWELAESARRMQPQLKVLLTSGYALETLAERGRLPTGAIVLNKPYRKAELARRVREALAPAE